MLNFPASPDAHSAIELLWRAARLAEVEEDPQVNQVHVHRSQHEFVGISPELRIQELTYYQRLVLRSIAEVMQEKESQIINSSEVRRHYLFLCDELGISPRERSTFAEYLQLLENQQLIQRTVQSGLPNNDQYHRVDIPRMICSECQGQCEDLVTSLCCSCRELDVDELCSFCLEYGREEGWKSRMSH